MKKKILGLVGLLGILSFPLAVSAEEGTVITVCETVCDVVTLADAVEAASDGYTIQLGESLTIDSTVTIDKSLTIDLNGHDIDASGLNSTAGGDTRYVLVFNAENAEFTLTDESSSTAGTITSGNRGILVKSGTLTIERVTVTSIDRVLQIEPGTDTGIAKAILNSGKLEITTTNSGGRAVKLWGNNTDVSAIFEMNGGEIVAPKTSSGSTGIDIGNYNANDESNIAGGATVTLTGGTITAFNGVRLSGNGELGMVNFYMYGGTIDAANSGILTVTTTGADYTNIQIYGGTITASKTDEHASFTGDAVAINQSQTGTLIIGKEDGTGPTITGETAIAIKEGDVTINGGTITATGEYRTVATARDDGTEDTGAAISITSNSTYASGVTLTINGGTFISENGNALYEGIAVYEGNTPAATSSYVSSITITGGEFIAKEASVVVEEYETTDGFITGGTYSSDVSAYISSAATLTLAADGTYVVATSIENPSTNDDVMTYIVIGIIALCGIGASVFYLKKN